MRLCVYLFAFWVCLMVRLFNGFFPCVLPCLHEFDGVYLLANVFACLFDILSVCLYNCSCVCV